MNIRFSYAIAAAAALTLFSCAKEEIVDFAVDSDKIEMEPVGGERKLKISSPGKWVASSNVPWITVSPANGEGSVDCRIIVDSSVVFSAVEAQRQGVVRIQSDEWENKEITVTQKNFPYQIALEKTGQNIPNFKAKADRWFEVKLSANTDFKVEMEYTEDSEAGIKAGWLAVEDHKLTLDRGARPRNVTLKFNWEINSIPSERLAKVKFVPVNEEGEELGTGSFSVLDVLDVVQSSAVAIKENSREGDSTALLGIARTLGLETIWDSAEKMSNWAGVTLWDTDDERDGRVKSADFTLFSTDDGIPFEVQYLTAAEELRFYSNMNSFLKRDLDLGPYILKLKQLKKLTIGAYGIEKLPDDFKNLKSLEYLDLSGNNFTEIPEIITEANFPNLKALIINANQRGLLYDLSNLTIEESNFAYKYGGLYSENLKSENQIEGGRKNGFPVRLLKWSKLEKLVLSVNFLQGVIPSDDYVSTLGLEKYTKEEVEKADTLASKLIGMPKVFPNMEKLAINLNRFHGKLPDWLLYHPKLDLWQPMTLIFYQEGKDIDGKLAAFDNAPTSLEYYYKLDGYRNKKYSPYNVDDK